MIKGLSIKKGLLKSNQENLYWVVAWREWAEEESGPCTSKGFKHEKLSLTISASSTDTCKLPESEVPDTAVMAFRMDAINNPWQVSSAAYV